MVLALASGCGLDDTRILDRTGLTSLEEERTFDQGALQITQRVETTALSIGTLYNVRANLLNTGADLPAARVELVAQRVLDVFGGGTELDEERVVARQELGTFPQGATRVVALEHREFGSVRIQLFLRVVSAGA